MKRLLILATVLLLPGHTTSICQVEFTGAVKVVVDATTQTSFCQIVVQDISIVDDADDDPSTIATHACISELYTVNTTDYGPIALVQGTSSEFATTVVAEQALGQTSFLPYIYPFRGSIESFQYSVWPALNDTVCGEVTDCNNTKFVNVDVFTCVLPPATPSPTTLAPSPAIVVVPSQGVMATRMPFVLVPSETPVAGDSIRTKAPFKAAVTPSPTILPMPVLLMTTTKAPFIPQAPAPPSPTILLAPVPTEEITVRPDESTPQGANAAIQSSPSSSSYPTSLVMLLVLGVTTALVLVIC